MYELPSYDIVQRIAIEQNVGELKSYGKEIIFKSCPYCHGGKHKDSSTFAINMETGRFNCRRTSCGVKGGWKRFVEDFGYAQSETPAVEKTYRTFKKSIQPIVPRPLSISYLASRGISEQTANDYSVTDNKGLIVFPIFDENGDVVNVKYRNPTYVKGESKGPKEWFEKDCKPYLYGINVYHGDNSRMILCEGQLDAMSCHESGIANAFSVPGGAKGFSWWPYSFEFVSRFKELVVFGDCEKGKVTLLDDMRVRFKGLVRCVPIEAYRGCKDANELLQKYGKEAVKEAVEKASLIPVRYIKQLSDVSVTTKKKPKLKTGFPTINKILGGGLAFGGVTIVTGKSGEGKSVMTGSILVEAREQGYNVFAYSGELPDSQFREWIDLQVAGTHCIPYIDETGEESGYTVSEPNRAIISHWYHDHIFIFSEDEVDTELDVDGPKSLCGIVELSIMQYQCKVILIDNMMTGLALEDYNENDTLEKQKKFIDRLRSMAKRFDVAIILVAHKRKLMRGSFNAQDEILGASEVANYAYTILSYERGGDDIDPEDRLLKITKNRENGMLEEKGVVIKYDKRSKRVFEQEPYLVNEGTEKGRVKEYGCFREMTQEEKAKQEEEDSRVVPSGFSIMEDDETVFD